MENTEIKKGDIVQLIDNTAAQPWESINWLEEETQPIKEGDTFKVEFESARKKIDKRKKLIELM